MDRELMRARQVLGDSVRRELNRLRRMAEGEEFEPAELATIADRIENAVRILERVPLILAEP